MGLSADLVFFATISIANLGHGQTVDTSRVSGLGFPLLQSADGDRKYSEKSVKYYKKLGLNAIVRNIPESRQAQVVRPLLNRYRPDILVITGHDAILKKDRSYNNLYNFRNSRHFVKAVREARRWGEDSQKLVIFARCMSKFF